MPLRPLPGLWLKPEASLPPPFRTPTGVPLGLLTVGQQLHRLDCSFDDFRHVLEIDAIDFVGRAVVVGVHVV